MKKERKMQKLLFLLFLCFPFSAIAQTAAPAKAATDNWERMRQCSEQTNRIAQKHGWKESKHEVNRTLATWQNHYSPRHQKCFVRVYYIYDDSAWSAKDGSKPKFPNAYSQLYDAYEDREIAAATVSRNDPDPIGIFCTISGDSRPCEICRSYIEDRMTN